MAQRPSFGALKKTKPQAEPAHVAEAAPSPAPAKAKPAERIQTSLRFDPEMWAALNALATRKRIEMGRRVTVHELMIDAARNLLAINGIKLSE